MFLDAYIPDEDKPVLYDRFIDECYIICKNMNMSYNDILQISPTERQKLKKCLIDEAKRQKELLDKKKAEREANQRNR